MDSKLFAICVMLLVASVISLSEGNAIDTQFDRQLDNVQSGVASVSHGGYSETQNSRHKRDLMCDDAQCTIDCLADGKLLGGKCKVWFFCVCN